MERKVGLGVATALTGAAAFFAFHGEGSAAPVNPTLEQISHDVHANLGGMAIDQQFEFKTAAGEDVKVFNLTKNPVNMRHFERMVRYYVSDGQTGDVRSLAIHPHTDSAQSEIVTSTETYQYPAEHDFVIIPQGMAVPDGIDTSAVTVQEGSRDISIIGDTPANDPQPTALGLGVEACQSFIDEAGAVGVDANADPIVAGDLVQESMCNSFGLAMNDAAQGMSYDDYKKASNQTGWTVTKQSYDFDGRTYSIDPYLFPSSEYTAMVAAVGPNAGN